MKNSKVDFCRFINDIIFIEQLEMLKEQGLPVPSCVKNSTVRYGDFLYKNHKERFNMLYLLWKNGDFVTGLLFTSDERLMKKIESINTMMEYAYKKRMEAAFKKKE